MLRNRAFGHARFTVRLFGRGVFVGLLGLALTVAIVSFLTACRCDEPFIRTDSSLQNSPQPDGPPKTPASGAAPNANVKDNPPLQVLPAIPTIPTDTKTNGGN
jgi:hypothetical protein